MKVTWIVLLSLCGAMSLPAGPIRAGFAKTENKPPQTIFLRGYDLLPYLPVIAGRIVGARAARNRVERSGGQE